MCGPANKDHERARTATPRAAAAAARRRRSLHSGPAAPAVRVGQQGRDRALGRGSCDWPTGGRGAAATEPACADPAVRPPRGCAVQPDRGHGVGPGRSVGRRGRRTRPPERSRSARGGQLRHGPRARGRATRNASSVATSRARGAPAAHDRRTGQRRDARRVPALAELDRSPGVHAVHRDLRAAARGRVGRLPEGLGAVPARQDAAGAGPRRTRARAVRGHPSVPGRQRPGRTARRHAAAHRARRPPGAAAVPQRLVRGDAIRVLRPSARDDGEPASGGSG